MLQPPLVKVSAPDECNEDTVNALKRFVLQAGATQQGQDLAKDILTAQQQAFANVGIQAPPLFQQAPHGQSACGPAAAPIQEAKPDSGTGAEAPPPLTNRPWARSGPPKPIRCRIKVSATHGRKRSRSSHRSTTWSTTSTGEAIGQGRAKTPTKEPDVTRSWRRIVQSARGRGNVAKQERIHRNSAGGAWPAQQLCGR